jgi:hypothetical protein
MKKWKLLQLYMFISTRRDSGSCSSQTRIIQRERAAIPLPPSSDCSIALQQCNKPSPVFSCRGPGIDLAGESELRIIPTGKKCLYPGITNLIDDNFVAARLEKQ